VHKRGIPKRKRGKGSQPLRFGGFAGAMPSRLRRLAQLLRS